MIKNFSKNCARNVQNYWRKNFCKKIPRTFYLKSFVEEDFKILLNYEVKIFWSVEDKIFKFLRKDLSGDGWEEKICEIEKIFEIEIVGLDFKKINLREIKIENFV